jgi:eukaryotic-like serine/threonine-protein kinase
MAILPGARLGPYEILSAIGAGGMGEVYRARDTRLNRDVALKVLPDIFARDSQRMGRFEREARLLAWLNHPNIAAIYGLEESGPIRALVMELVEGPTLADRIAAGPMPLDEALPVAKQIAEAIEYAHDNNVIHRDLKPANIKVKADGAVKVLDFGLAKALSDEPSEAEMANSPTLSMAATMQGVILGTAAYMAPEQAKGKKVDRRADIWAFGVVLYEMMTGKPLHSGETISETLASVMMRDSTLEALPADTPAAIRNLLRRCLEKNPKRRMQSAGEARIILEDILSGATPADPSVAAAAPAARSQRATWIAAGAAAVFLLALAALSFVHFRETPPAVRPARFFILPPEKTTFATAPQVVAVSPDGTKLAFQATNANGTANQLWIRPLDSLSAQPLPGTESSNPQQFWSPDSRYVAFYADGKLKKIAVAGGPAQTLCDIFGNGQGSWNKDGVILASGGLNPIYRVSSAGGAPVAVTTVDKEHGETGHLWPHFLPDGNHFLYLALNSDSAKSAIRVGSLNSKETKLLLNDLSFAMYAPPGYLLFQRDGTLMAQPFDAAKLQFTGDAFPIAEQVEVNTQNGRVAFDVSQNGVLVYRSAVGSNTQLTWFDRSGKELGRIGEPAGYLSPKLSPDGKRVAVQRTTGFGTPGDIWVYDLARNTQTRLTFDPAHDSNPLWSPDGSRIAFASTRGNSFGLYQKNSDGTGDDDLLLKAGSSVLLEDWSLDGRFLVYTSTEGRGRDVSYLPLAGSPAGQVAGDPSTSSGQVGKPVAFFKPVPFLKTPFLERHAQLSPDGRWMAYISNESETYQVYVQSFPSGGGKWQVSMNGGVQPRWRHDGKELFYIAPDGKLMSVTVKAGTTFEAGTPEPLFQTRIYGLAPSVYYSQQYDVTPDAQRFLLNVDAADVIAAPLTVVLDWTAAVQK